jgi:hypothetical protein
VEHLAALARLEREAGRNARAEELEEQIRAIREGSSPGDDASAARGE